MRVAGRRTLSPTDPAPLPTKSPQGQTPCEPDRQGVDREPDPVDSGDKTGQTPRIREFRRIRVEGAKGNLRGRRIPNGMVSQGGMHATLRLGIDAHERRIQEQEKEQQRGDGDHGTFCGFHESLRCGFPVQPPDAGAHPRRIERSINPLDVPGGIDHIREIRFMVAVRDSLEPPSC
jgi:hypothetical protein